MKDIKSGIYKIEINQKVYVGSAKSIEGRIYRHLRDLKKGNHCNAKLQHAFNKYGESDFKYSVLEFVDKESLIPREQHYIDALKPFYNISKTAGSSLGTHHSDETKARLSRMKKGKQISLGRILSEETKRKIGEKAKRRGVPNACLEASKRTNQRIERSKLNKKQLLEILSLYSDNVTQTELAKRYGVSQRFVCRVVNGLGIYKNLEAEKAQCNLFLQRESEVSNA